MYVIRETYAIYDMHGKPPPDGEGLAVLEIQPGDELEGEQTFAHIDGALNELLAKLY